MLLGKAFKAARNYLDLSQPQVADALSMSTGALLAIEKGESKMQMATERKLIQFFALKGIIFENNKIVINNSTITEMDGDDWWNNCLRDIAETLKNSKNKELLLQCSDDSLSSEETNDIIREMRKNGITMRQIIKDGNTQMMGYENEYRWMSKENFSSRVTAIYADKVTICADDNTKGLIFKDAGLAQNFRNNFNELWKYLPEAGRSTADVRY